MQDAWETLPKWWVFRVTLVSLYKTFMATKQCNSKWLIATIVSLSICKFEEEYHVFLLFQPLAFLVLSLLLLENASVLGSGCEKHTHTSQGQSNEALLTTKTLLEYTAVTPYYDWPASLPVSCGCSDGREGEAAPAPAEDWGSAPCPNPPAPVIGPAFWLGDAGELGERGLDWGVWREIQREVKREMLQVSVRNVSILCLWKKGI